MKKNKLIIILLLILCIELVGITIAYFSNSTTLDNIFSTKEYGTTYTEEFVSPDNWLPGDTTNKTIIATNTGQVDQAVRISLSEEWKSKNGDTLSGLIDSNGLLTDEEENSEKAAIINFSDNNDWTYDNGYYYYNYKLAPQESTSSLIDSVSFNSKVKLGDTCIENETATGKIITCNSSSNDYDNATYKLTITIETVQYNKYATAWSTDVAIASMKPVAIVCPYEIGDEITYDDETYYVIRNSDSTVDYVVALKDTPLTAQQVNTYGDESVYVSEDGEYLYYKNETCFAPGWDDNCVNDYNQSFIKLIVEGWSNNYNNDLININDYNARIISKDDLIYMDYIFYENTGNTFIEIAGNPYNNFVIKDYSYWGMDSIDDSWYALKVSNNEYPIGFVADKFYIRPVINLKKSAIESACPTH